MSKKRSGGAHDDDDSVDSHGNVRGLIAYEDDESEEEFVTDEETPSDRSNLTPQQRRELRRSARTAAKRGKNRGTPKDAPKKSPKTAVSRRRVVESESEDESAFEEEASPPTKKKGFMPRKKRAEQRLEQEEDEDEDDDEDEDEEEDEDLFCSLWKFCHMSGTRVPASMTWTASSQVYLSP
jgi:hypothetical protein